MLLFPPSPQEDILAEAEAHDGRLLVTREAEADGGGGNGGNGGAVLARQVVEAFEPVAGPEAVQTPKQVRGLRRCMGCGAGAACGSPAAPPVRLSAAQRPPMCVPARSCPHAQVYGALQPEPSSKI